MSDTMEDNEEMTESARARVKMAAWMSRNGTRAQKRVISTGKAARRGVGSLGSKLVNQVVEPYTGLKIALSAVTMVAAGVAMWYYTIVIALFVAMAVGSWLGGLAAGVAFYWVVSRYVYMPMAITFGNYSTNATIYRTKKPNTINIGRIVGFPMASV